MIYYLYIHVRNDKKEIFYVGIGRSSIENSYNRAFHFTKRNKFWKNVYNKCKKDISVSIIKVFDNLRECQDAEIELIEKLGRRITNSGILTNIGRGGEFTNNCGLKIVQYDIHGRFVKIWNTINELCSFYGIKKGKINSAIANKGSSLNSQWRRYSKNFKKYINPFINKSHKKVYQFDLDCNFLKEYKNITHASKETNICASSISYIANKTKTRKSAGGYRWSFNKNDCACASKKIYQFDLEGKFIKSFNAIGEIKKLLNIKSDTAIRNCFTGKQKQAYGFIWKKEKGYL